MTLYDNENISVSNASFFVSGLFSTSLHFHGVTACMYSEWLVTRLYYGYSFDRINKIAR